MKKVAVFSAVALLALAGSANAQSTLAGATLELRIVAVDGTAATSLTRPGSTAAMGAADVNRTRRFEVQYRITGDQGLAAGLSSMQFNITSSLSGGTVGRTVDRAALTRFQANSGGNTNASIADTSSDVSGASTNLATGLHRPYRGGIAAPAPNNNNAANGIPVLGVAGAPSTGNPALNFITPLTLAENGQNDGGFYGLYSFTVTVGDSSLGTDPDNDGFVTINLSAAPIPDGQTGNAWGGFESGNPVPQTSTHRTDGSASFRVEIPAPGSLALIGLGGLVATRRRRA